MTVVAISTFTAAEPNEISFKKGDTLYVVEETPGDWWKGLYDGSYGLFPKSSVRKQ